MNVLFIIAQTEPLPSPSLSRLVSASPAACEKVLPLWLWSFPSTLDYQILCSGSLGLFSAQ